MRVAVGLLALASAAPGQTILGTISPDGGGYGIALSGPKGTAFASEHARWEPIPLGRNIGRWEGRAATVPTGPGVTLADWLTYPQPTIQLHERGELDLKGMPPALLRAQGFRLTVPGSSFALVSRQLTPMVAPVPPRPGTGTRMLGALAVRAIGLVRENEDVPLAERAFRVLTMTRADKGRGSWMADLEGGQGGTREVELSFYPPLRTPGLLPLSPEPAAARYVGRTFWAYPNSVEALSLSGRVRGTALMDRRRVRVTNLVRIWGAGSVMLSGPLAPMGGPLGTAGMWPALHPLVAFVEPVGPEPVRVSLPRTVLDELPISAAEAVAFARHPRERRYFLVAADFWHLDRMLRGVSPERDLRGATREIRRAVAMARPVPGMTPAQVGWAVGWPNDPMLREALERATDDVWEYPAPFGWTRAEFRGGRLVSWGPGVR